MCDCVSLVRKIERESACVSKVRKRQRVFIVRKTERDRVGSNSSNKFLTKIVMAGVMSLTILQKTTKNIIIVKKVQNFKKQFQLLGVNLSHWVSQISEPQLLFENTKE